MHLYFFNFVFSIGSSHSKEGRLTSESHQVVDEVSAEAERVRSTDSSKCQKSEGAASEHSGMSIIGEEPKAVGEGQSLAMQLAQESIPFS